MIGIVATNITSPLGWTSEQNYLAVKAGHTALRNFHSWRGIKDTVTVGAFTPEQEASLLLDGFTKFESLAIRSVKEALSHSDIDVASDRTVFILSTTKGNVGELSDAGGNYSAPGVAAKKIASAVGFTTEPVTVCNACISGVTAQMLAGRLIAAGFYDTAVVCGADCLTEFTLSGFLSFKSLDPSECRPFDIDRLGLNLGEAAATVIYAADAGKDAWRFVSGEMNNDAYHLSAPSPVGDGTVRAINHTLEGFDKECLAFVSAHGTATMFNDQMESKAIASCGLSEVPVSAVKGYFGHTLGAAGVLETIISILSAEDGTVLPVRGFSEIGVSGKMNVVTSPVPTEKTAFLKIISGFGGCNGALLFTKDAGEFGGMTPEVATKVVHTVHITPSSVSVDGEELPVAMRGRELLDEIYKSHIADYPKFHKMDMLGKLVFVASELLTAREDAARENVGGEDGDRKDENRAVILFNATSSIVQDLQHIRTINDTEGFFPSPSVFLYTLPNISIGEVAIRNSYKGETSLYILPEKDNELMDKIIKASFAGSLSRSMITGWADCSGEDTFEAEMKIIEI
ncbi:MAG: 3-oxoacyl-ACP synthase [Bacteroidales bacterium]|nr:3-oxoacyl-ACP synthase [Bacteroidales bacterium]